MGDLQLRRVRVSANLEIRDLLILDRAIADPAALPTPNCQTIEGNGRIVLPGLVNVHTHLDKAFLASRISNATGTIAEARNAMRVAKATLSTADIRARAERALRQSIQGGVTAMRTHVDVDPSVGLRGIEALLGLREDYADLIDLQIVAFPQEGIHEQPGTLELLDEALRLGADVIGGHLSIAATPAALTSQTDAIFNLATAHDRDIDVHVDFDIARNYADAVSSHDDGRDYPDHMGVVHLAERTIAEGYQGRVTASHVCALDAVPPRLRTNIVDLIRKAGVSVIALPGNNMYVHGREDPVGARRGVTRLRELQDAGVRVAVGPDNIRDAFNPYGRTDLLQNAFLAALALHYVTPNHFWTVLELHTDSAAEIMHLSRYGIAPGCRADLVVLEARSLDELLDGYAAASLVIKNGSVIARTTTQREAVWDGSMRPRRR